MTHILSGLGAGFFAVCLGSPVDVVKSRVMGDKVGRYNGVIDCFVKTAREEGAGAFYKGEEWGQRVAPLGHTHSDSRG